MNEKLALDDEIKKVIREGVLKFGKISETYLMKALKIKKLQAFDIINEYTLHECSEWDFMEIDCTMKEFSVCRCKLT